MRTQKYGFGLTCDTRDPAAIREAIVRFKSDPALLRRCAENELRCAPQYDWKQAVHVLDTVYPS